MRPAYQCTGFGLALLLLLPALPLAAQRLSVDQGVRAAGLWCFPLADDGQRWKYLPGAARLATDSDGLPQFSFVRYVVNQLDEGDSAATIQQAGGGGVLHFLVLYDTPDEQVRRAQAVLQQRFEDDQLVLQGPVVFDDGRFSLVSSILSSDSGSSRHRLLASGRAPVLEGNRLAFSFGLEPEPATLLLESFKMATPDVSLVFDLSFSGLADAYDAHMEIDWSKVHESMGLEAGGSVYFISAEVKTQIDELLRNSSIRLESRGSDSAMEALLNHVYEKILELLFSPLEPERVPAAERGGLLDALGNLLGGDGALSSGNTTGFGAHVGYRYKNMRSEGTSVLDFNHQATAERHAYISFNIGNLYQQYGDDQRFFRDVNLGDPAFDQRVVHVALDGGLLPEFDRLVDSVTVTLRKLHEAGGETVRELVLNRDSFDSPSQELRMVYGWNQDRDRLAWLEYDFRTHWSFKGGGEHRTDWRRVDTPMINLFVPYTRRTVQLVDAGLSLADMGARAAVLRVAYPFFGTRRSEQMVVRAGRPMEEPSVEITLPLDQFEYDYNLTWLLSNGSSVSIEGRDGSGLVFLDAPPAAASN
jgi:hypothetical protein